jgi:hypothetical protein
MKLFGTANRKAEKLAEIGIDIWNVKLFVLSKRVTTHHNTRL